jgi:hypothetical protein
MTKLNFSERIGMIRSRLRFSHGQHVIDASRVGRFHCFAHEMILGTFASPQESYILLQDKGFNADTHCHNFHYYSFSLALIMPWFSVRRPELSGVPELDIISRAPMLLDSRDIIQLVARGCDGKTLQGSSMGTSPL